MCLTIAVLMLPHKYSETEAFKQEICKKNSNEIANFAGNGTMGIGTGCR